ncbi:Endonuclease/exonuclease/phosphatase, partial [Rhodotorula diobovata]
PPARRWLTPAARVGPRQRRGRSSSTVSVMTYNILCDKYATSERYGYTSAAALDWDYRKQRILGELLKHKPDIICLQEVDAEQFETFFLPRLSEHGYDGVHYRKSRAWGVPDQEKRQVDGCATFFNSDSFALVRHHVVEFSRVALQRFDRDKTDHLLDRVVSKDNVGVLTLLENRRTGERLIVAQTHIHWNPLFCDVKLVQVALLMEELAKVADGFAREPPRTVGLAKGLRAPRYVCGVEVATIVCGDLNSTPDSAVYEVLLEGRVAADHPELRGYSYGRDFFTHPYELKSAHMHVEDDNQRGELPFTTFTPDFTDTIDYIWYSAPTLAVRGVLGEVDGQYAASRCGFPDAHFPSDHIPLVAEFGFR